MYEYTPASVYISALALQQSAYCKKSMYPLVDSILSNSTLNVQHQGQDIFSALFPFGQVKVKFILTGNSTTSTNTSASHHMNSFLHIFPIVLIRGRDGTECYSACVCMYVCMHKYVYGWICYVHT